MEYRRLGSSDLVVSEISLGSWLTYSGGIERERSFACIDKAREVGINFFDTANIYGRGSAETLLGEALSGVERGSYILATKLYFPMTPTDRGLSRAQIVKQLDASLARLRTDYVDLYQCHRYDFDTPLEETMAALSDAVRQGKARYIGFSEWPIDRIEAALSMAGIERFVSSQPQYSMLHPVPDDALIPLCRRHGISQIVFSPLAEGILTGKYPPGAPPPADSRGGHQEMGAGLRGRWLGRPAALAAVQQLVPLAAEAGLSLGQFALAWVLREPNVASAIIGATRPQQVVDNAAASGRVVDPALFAAAAAILAPSLGLD
jgi:aryl-alcohol dehydrogenase-like predicted oxidoreductase